MTYYQNSCKILFLCSQHTYTYAFYSLAIGSCISHWFLAAHFQRERYSFRDSSFSFPSTGERKRKRPGNAKSKSNLSEECNLNPRSPFFRSVSSAEKLKIGDRSINLAPAVSALSSGAYRILWLDFALFWRPSQNQGYHICAIVQRNHIALLL